MQGEPPAGRVLIVDDTAASLRLMVDILAAAGYLSVGVDSGPAALERAAGEPFDLVLVDVVMPGMDGYAVCRALREQPATQFVPIILLTSSDAPERVRALELGADDFIRRPVERAELLARVRSLLRIKRYHDQIETQAVELARLNAELAARVAAQVEHIERLNQLRRFVAPQIAELLVSSAEPQRLARHRREIAVAACGLHGFAAFAESVEPEVVMQVLEELYATLGPVVHRFEGTVGGFSEAGLTVFFNDPLPCPDGALRAARMALAMRTELRRPAAGWRRRGHQLELCVGIDQGFATLGRLGFEGRDDYAAVGRVVSVATRLAERAEAGQILLTRRVEAEVAGQLRTTPLGELQLPGLPTPLAVVRLEAERDDERVELSAREREVAALVARGLTNRQIAERLVISARTAETHLERIFTKLDLRTRAQLAIWAVEHGLGEGDGGRGTGDG